MNIGNFYFKYRGYTPIPILIILFFWARTTAFSFGGGLLLMGIGEAIRLWSVSYLGKKSRTRTADIGDLVTCGPYAWVRNPIYIGNMLIYSGAVVIANVWLPYFLILLWGCFAFQYYMIVKWEEAVLEKHYGEAYSTYKQHVPRFIPCRIPSQRPETVLSNYKMALSSERSTFISHLVVLIFFMIRWLNG